MEEKILSPVESDLLLVLVKWELIDPHILVNYLLKRKTENMLEQGKSMNYILNSLSMETKLSKYFVAKRLKEYESPVNQLEIDLLKNLLREYIK